MKGFSLSVLFNSNHGKTKNKPQIHGDIPHAILVIVQCHISFLCDFVTSWLKYYCNFSIYVIKEFDTVFLISYAAKISGKRRHTLKPL